MSKSIKPKNDTYISDLGIVHNRQILKEKIDSIDNELQSLDTRLQNQEIRSTAERVIGKWVDGKPLYEKIIDTTHYGDIAHGIANIDRICYFYAQIYNGTNCYPLPITYYGRAGSFDYLSAYCDKTTIHLLIQTGWGDAWRKTYTIRYTKTTDRV